MILNILTIASAAIVLLASTMLFVEWDERRQPPLFSRDEHADALPPAALIDSANEIDSEIDPRVFPLGGLGM